jgi:hypothetical protein
MTDQLKNPHILNMFYVSDDENTCITADVHPETNDVTISDQEIEFSIPFEALEGWISCLIRARDLLVFHNQEGES